MKFLTLPIYSSKFTFDQGNDSLQLTRFLSPALETFHFPAPVGFWEWTGGASGSQAAENLLLIYQYSSRPCAKSSRKALPYILSRPGSSRLRQQDQFLNALVMIYRFACAACCPKFTDHPHDQWARFNLMHILLEKPHRFKTPLITITYWLRLIKNLTNKIKY
jgi:hypothetical protein